MRLRADGKIEDERASGSVARASAATAASIAAPAPAPVQPPQLAAADPAQAQLAAAIAGQGKTRREEPAPGLLGRVARFLGLEERGSPAGAQQLPSNVTILPPGSEFPPTTMSPEVLERLRYAARPYIPQPHDRNDGRLRVTHPRSIIGVRG